MANIGRLSAILSLDGQGFGRGLRQAESQLGRFSRNITSLHRSIGGAFAAVGAVTFAKQLTDLSDSATRTSTRRWSRR